MLRYTYIAALVNILLFGGEEIEIVNIFSSSGILAFQRRLNVSDEFQVM
jgi:hypothetical protein